MPRVLITDTLLRNLKHTAVQKTILDNQILGFGVRVNKYRKTFTLSIGKERRRVTLGHYPHMSLKDARKAALHKKFGNHVATPTFESALRDFVRLHLQPNTKPSSAKVIERLLERHFAPIWGKKRLGDITARDLVVYLNSIAETPSEANQAYRAASLMFNWAAQQHLLEVSPFIHCKPPHKTESRDRLLTDDEIRAIWQESYPYLSLHYITFVLYKCPLQWTTYAHTMLLLA